VKKKTVRKVLPTVLVQATTSHAATLTGRKARLYSFIAGKDRVRVSELYDWAMAQGLAYGGRPRNHIGWDVRQMVDGGALRVLPERRSVYPRRMLAIEIRGSRFGLYVPRGHKFPRVKPNDSFTITDNRGQFVPTNAERRVYASLTA
jgi:hypothetical protein